MVLVVAPVSPTGAVAAATSSVEVIKTVEGVADDFGWSFDFLITPEPAGQVFVQTASGTGDSSDTVGWSGLVPGQQYTVSEFAQLGFAAGELVCDGVTDLDTDPTTVTFVAPAGATISCSITNESCLPAPASNATGKLPVCPPGQSRLPKDR